MLKLKKDFTCNLLDKKTGADLFEFTAQQVGDPIFGAGFEGGGIASGNQSMTIMTEKNYQYNALQHNVLIEGRKWIITSVVPSIRRKLGAGVGTKVRKVYILTLE